jgi:protocatechuate 3,4-dioxygenase beta subunit
MLGPFYLPDQLAQEDLCRAGKGERLTVSGRVLGLPDCRPLPGALVEVWQADAKGVYTLAGGDKPDPDCLLRASVKADAEGRYRYRSILPGEYPGRPRHIHYRVSRPDLRPLVTQLYFQGDPRVEGGGRTRPRAHARRGGTLRHLRRGAGLEMKNPRGFPGGYCPARTLD